jgi:hypothetical protein
MTEQSELPVTGRSGDAATDQASREARLPATAAPAKRRQRRRSAGDSAAAAVAEPGATEVTGTADGKSAKRKTAAAPGKARVTRRKGEPDVIFLPALKNVLKSAGSSGKPRRRPPEGRAAAPTPAPASPAPAAAIVADPGHAEITVAPGAAGEYLPEYRSQTNGLRELLSSIDPFEDVFAPAATHAQLPSIEDGMHIPYNRPGIPGSPDLPVSPVRFLHHIANTLLALVLLVLAGLAYSHFVSPTGINWSVLQEAAGTAVQWTRAQLADRHEIASAVRVAEQAPVNVRSDTTIASTPRISTTSATAEVELPDAPAYADLNLSPDELERRIRELEQDLPATEPASTSAGRHSDSARSDEPAPSPADSQALRAASIDPEMEQQIFARAKAYLLQRDIASARMILNYAASLGSGISAMALAETFDPAYLARINLQEVDADLPEARKWYRTASSLGVKEADARLAALK